MNFKQLMEMLKNLGVKVEDATDGDQHGQQQQQQQQQQQTDFTQVADLIKAITSLQQGTQTPQQVNQNNSDVAALAAILAPMLTKTQEAPKAFEEGFFKDGKFDLDKINDASLKSALTEYTTAVQAKENQHVIDNAVKAELGKRHLAIKEDAFMKLLDLSKVKVDGDKVTGVTEAFDALKDSGVYKSAPTSPLNQGFNPMENKNTGAVTLGVGGGGLYAAAAEDAAE